jgi:hypothetical protein
MPQPETLSPACSGLDTTNPDVGPVPNILSGSGTGCATPADDFEGCIPWNIDNSSHGTHVTGGLCNAECAGLTTPTVCRLASCFARAPTALVTHSAAGTIGALKNAYGVVGVIGSGVRLFM